jgi:nucleotide-binding universal stress UspA family protein
MSERPIVRKILFPVDFSQFCTSMAEHVKRVQDMFQAQATLVHVCDLESHNGFELYVRCAQEIADEHREIAMRRLHTYLKHEFPLSECPRVLLTGEPASAIAELARDEEFDLIIMPTHAGVFRWTLLGSVTAKVLNEVECPVLTTEHARTPGPIEHRHWVCGLDLNQDAVRVLQTASRGAKQVNAKLSVIHVLSNGAQPEEPRMIIQDMQAAADCREAELHIAKGPIKESLINTSRQCGADVLIIGRPTSGFGRIRDLSYGLIRDSPFPVLSV